MLVARSALNYMEFVKEYFGKDVMANQGAIHNAAWL